MGLVCRSIFHYAYDELTASYSCPRCQQRAPALENRLLCLCESREVVSFSCCDSTWKSLSFVRALLNECEFFSSHNWRIYMHNVSTLTRSIFCLFILSRVSYGVCVCPSTAGGKNRWLESSTTQRPLFWRELSEHGVMCTTSRYLCVSVWV